MQQQLLEQPYKYTCNIAVVAVAIAIIDIGWHSVGEHNRNEIVGCNSFIPWY